MVTYLHIEQSFRALGPPFSATGLFLQAIGGCQKRLPKDRLRTDGCAERLSRSFLLFVCALRREKSGVGIPRKAFPSERKISKKWSPSVEPSALGPVKFVSRKKFPGNYYNLS